MDNDLQACTAPIFMDLSLIHAKKGWLPAMKALASSRQELSGSTINLPLSLEDALGTQPVIREKVSPTTNVVPAYLSF